jgi:hypothetical protein
MSEQVQKQRKSVKRIDECVAEHEARQEEDRVKHARHASRRSRRLVDEAEDFLVVLGLQGQKVW